jgi:hypothetical protein
MLLYDVIQLDWRTMKGDTRMISVGFCCQSHCGIFIISRFKQGSGHKIGTNPQKRWNTTLHVDTKQSKMISRSTYRMARHDRRIVVMEGSWAYAFTLIIISPWKTNWQDALSCLLQDVYTSSLAKREPISVSLVFWVGARTLLWAGLSFGGMRGNNEEPKHPEEPKPPDNQAITQNNTMHPVPRFSQGARSTSCSSASLAATAACAPRQPVVGYANKVSLSHCNIGYMQNHTSKTWSWGTPVLIWKTIYRRGAGFSIIFDCRTVSETNILILLRLCFYICTDSVLNWQQARMGLKLRTSSWPIG